MAYIGVPESVPGIRSLAMFRPETGKHIYALAQVLLRGDSPLTPAERELIASYVSALNNCSFCRDSHAAAARELFGLKREVVDCVIENKTSDSISLKLKALLNIAAKVQLNGREVQPEDVEQARHNGATDREIHDTVLIAATFCMFNRYVDGLNSLTPTDSAEYAEMGKRLATVGYVSPSQSPRN
jgi:uncharacterized peroxidase-related enzyme